MKKPVLVTGAGGSIGSELCAKLLDEGVKDLIAVDISEYNLYRLERKLERLVGNARVRYLLADVRHQSVIDALFQQERPGKVFHVAALKHVPILEYPHNTLEAFRTNILGTKVVLDAAVAAGCEQFLLVSTDKAVNPLSMMGASKAFAEGYCRDVAKEAEIPVGHGTRVVVVRFGNVVGSSGSVTPLWEQQIAEGGPVTITDVNMKRWFMEIDEAVDLVVGASEMATQRYSLYMLDMGEPVSIFELAKDLIERSGKLVPIQIIGIRPGEKLTEELNYAYEWRHSTPHPQIVQLIAQQGAAPEGFHTYVRSLQEACETRALDEAKKIVSQAVRYQGDPSVI